MNNNNSLILNYHDACIYYSDIRLLESRSAWLNDSCINYQMRRLEQTRKENQQKGKKYEDARQTNDNDNSGENNQMKKIGISHVEFMDPSIVSFFMHQLSIHNEDDCDEMISICQSWGLGINTNNPSTRGGTGQAGDTCRMILIPINDNNSAESLSFQTPGGGNHWSLLVVVTLDMIDGSRSMNATDQNDIKSLYGQLMFFHFDSMNGSNASTASSVAKKIQDMYSLLSTPYHGVDESTGGRKNVMNNVNINTLQQHQGTFPHSAINNFRINITECRALQQQNGYDCGLHTLFTAEILGKMDYLSLKNTATVDSARRNEYYATAVKNVQDEFEKCMDMSLHDYDSVKDMTKGLRKAMIKDIRTISKCTY